MLRRPPETTVTDQVLPYPRFFRPISTPRTLPPGSPTVTVAGGAKQKQEPCLSGSLRSDRPVRPAGLRGEIKGEASAARRMPEDIRPEGLPAAPGPSDCAEACNRTIQPQSGEEPNENAPRCGEIGRAHV